MADIEEKKARLLAPKYVYSAVSIGNYLGDVEAALAGFGRRDEMARIWRKDHTIWKPDSAEITN